MKKTPLLFIFLVSSALADPNEPPVADVRLTADQIQIVAGALNMASDTCTQNPNGCVIGLNKGPILQQLQAAMADLQKRKK